MNSPERRRPEALSLRRFFQEQMTVLLQALGGPAAVPAPGAPLEAAIEGLVEGTNPRLRVMGDYRRRLRQGTRGLLDHVETTVAALPGERAVDGPSFARDPLVNALFVSVQHIAQVLSESHSVQEYVARHGDGEVHGVLSVTRREKKVLGTVLQDDLLVREVPQVAVNFTGHQVRHPGAEEEAVRTRLRQELFESVVKAIRARLHAYCRDAHDGTAPGGAPVPLNPDRYLTYLGRTLEAPGALLDLQWHRLRLTHDSIRVEGSQAEVVNDFELPELSVGNLPPRGAVLIHVPAGILKDRARLLAEAERLLNI